MRCAKTEESHHLKVPLGQPVGTSANVKSLGLGFVPRSTVLIICHIGSWHSHRCVLSCAELHLNQLEFGNFS